MERVSIWNLFYNPRERITVFIGDAQNCGKSYFVGEFIKTYNKILHKKPVYLFSGLSEKEKHFEDYGIRAIIMDQENIKTLDLEKLKVDNQTGKRRGCLLIFDDTDRIRDKGLMTKTYKLLEDVLADMRGHASQAGKADIYAVVTNHEINDYQRTRSILTNCNYVVVFPYYSLAKQMNLVMDEIGIGKETRKKITYYKGRTVIIRKVAPMYCPMRKRVFLFRK